MKYKVLYDENEVYQIGDINFDNEEIVNWLQNLSIQDAINFICEMWSMELEKIN